MQVDLKDKWRNLAHAVVYKKQTRRVWLSDEQKERIIRCLPQYNPDQVSLVLSTCLTYQHRLQC